VAYRADIEIAVKGAQELKRLQNEIRVASDAVDSLNSNLSGIANLVPRSFDNLNKTVAEAAKSFNAAALGTKEATDAAREYIQATDTLNVGLRERVALLAKVRAEQRRTVPGDAGTGQQTPALPPQLIRTYEIGKNWVKFFQDAAKVAVDLRARSLNTQKNWNDFFATAAQAAVNVKANSLNTQKNWNDFFATAAQAAVNVKANSLNTQKNWNDFFATAAKAAVNVKANSLNTRKNWNDFFATAAQAAVNVKANSLNTQKNWNDFFATAAQAAVNVKANSLNTQKNWNDFFATAAQAAVNVKANSVNTKNSWNTFFTEAAQLANDLTDRTREIEGKNSAAARGRLAADAERRRTATKGAARKTFGIQGVDFESITGERAGGAAPAPGSPAALKARNAMTQNALIGGAFPMLFGGGAGAVIGGAAGGFIPGNPMMSIVTSALGTMVDEFAAAAIAVGAALMDTATTFDVVKEKSLFSSKELEKYATKLQEAGFVASASAVAQFDIISKVGNKGVEDLATLASESDKLNRAFAELTVQMQAFIAGPLAVLLEQMAAVVGQATTAQRAKVLEENLRAQGKTAAADKLASRVQGAQLKGLGQSFNFSNVDPLNPLSLVAPNTTAIESINEEIQGIINEFEKIELKPKIKLTPEQINKEDLAVLEKRLEAISIGKSLTDAVKQAAREQKDLDKQRADLVRSYEESIGSIRKKVEDEVSRRRFSILEKENQLLDLQGQNRIKQLQAANAQEIALAGRGERSEVASVAKEVAQIVANFTEQQLSAEEEAAKIKRKAALDARKFDFEAAQFKANIEKEVAKLNIETARRVADINEGARRRNEETDSRKFDIEKSIARIKIIQLKNELAAASFRADLDDVDKRSIQQSIDNLTTTQAVIKNLEPPAPLRGVGQVGGGGVSTTNFDAIVSKEKGAIQALVTEALKGIDLTVKGSREALAQNLLNVTDKIDQSLKDIETKEADAEVNRLRRIELINAGLTEGVAQRVMELEQLKKITLAQYDALIAEVEGRIVKEAKTAAQLATNEALREEIKLIEKRKAALEGNLGTFDATTGTGTGAIGNATTSQAGKQIQEFITTATAELNNLEQVAINVSKGIGDAVGNSIASGISGLIEGTTSAKEVFATFLRDIGQMLVEQGTKMIATYIAIGIAKIFAGMGNNFTGGTSSAVPTDAAGWAGSFNTQLPGVTSIGNIGFAKGGAFSNSIVSSPTLFKFADGGTTRTGLMGEAGPEAIMPLKRGSDGSLGVQATGLREAMGRPPGGANGSTVLNMSFQSTTINGTEYVSRDQLEAAMAATRRQAAKEGANRGMNMTLDKIQNSPSTRSRVGIR
jgi:lambda family phage tail tape measure protein